MLVRGRTVALVSFLILFATACQRKSETATTSQPMASKSPEQIETEPTKTKPPVPAVLLNSSAKELCAKLSEIKVIPSWDPNETDPIYEALIEKGDGTVPCLIEKISDKTLMPDPRYSVPHWQHFAVGDAAVFILIDILREDDLERETVDRNAPSQVSGRMGNQWCLRIL